MDNLNSHMREAMVECLESKKDCLVKVIQNGLHHSCCTIPRIGPFACDATDRNLRAWLFSLWTGLAVGGCRIVLSSGRF
jgi:hypothetical protein